MYSFCHLPAFLYVYLPAFSIEVQGVMFTYYYRQGYVTRPSPSFYPGFSCPHSSVNNYLPLSSILPEALVLLHLLHCTATYLVTLHLDLLAKAKSNDNSQQNFQSSQDASQRVPPTSRAVCHRSQDDASQQVE